MKVKASITPELIRIKSELTKLNGMKIRIGIQGNADSDILMIARVHEYGAVIHAKKKYLAIPIHKSSYDKSPRDFKDLFFIRSENGFLFGVTEKRNRKNSNNADNLNFLFLFLPSVTIPERSFIRAGYDNNVNRLAQVIEQELIKIIKGEKTAEEAAGFIGGKAVDFIREYLSDSSNFVPKGKIQKERAPSWADNPLMVTGRLRNAITFQVESGE